jgi:hypothetical protein
VLYLIIKLLTSYKLSRVEGSNKSPVSLLYLLTLPGTISWIAVFISLSLTYLVLLHSYYIEQITEKFVASSRYIFLPQIIILLHMRNYIFSVLLFTSSNNSALEIS